MTATPTPLTPPSSTDGGAVDPKPWVHDTSHPYFLPPNAPQPAALSLVSDSLDIVREYRDYVDTLGKLEQEHGRAMQAAVRKLETKLDIIIHPPPGGRKAPETTLVKALRAHLAETKTVASLHIKRPGALNDQLIKPLTHLERRVGDTSRRLGTWGKDIRTRWDAGRERVEAARAKYHSSVRDHEAALARFRACPAPGTMGKSDGEWVKLEKAAADAEANRADRKRAYIVAVAGEGLEGGGGRDLVEGGGDWGWGEESRALYGHVEFTLLELIKHHAYEDKSHNQLLSHIFERGEKCYDLVCIAADQNAFLQWNATMRQNSFSSNGYDSPPESPTEHGSPASGPKPGLSPLSPLASGERPVSYLPPSPGGNTQICPTFVPPPMAKNDTPVLDTAKRADQTWLVNRWLQSNGVITELEGTNGLGGTLPRKRQDLEKLKQLCVSYAKNRGHGDAEDVWDKRIALQRAIGEDERRVAVAKAERVCLEAVLGQMTHDFKEKQFTTPSPCGACEQKVWGPLKAELSCRTCGLALHSKCALHIDPECTGLKSSRRKSTHTGIRRQITTRLRRQSMFESPHGAPQEYRPNPTRIEPLREEELQVSPFVTTTSEVDRPAIVEALMGTGVPSPPPTSAFPPPASASTSPPAPSVVLARVMADYEARDQHQMHVWGGEIVRVLEPDVVGNGWVKARRGMENGDEGLVPQTFLDVVSKTSPSATDGGSGKFVVCTFEFPPTNHQLGPGQACIRKYQLYELSDEGHEYDAEWTELVVPDGSGVRLRGIVPKSYVKAV